ncbi:MAG: hypothetical protein ABI409_08880 [Ramlibacter sp.]
MSAIFPHIERMPPARGSRTAPLGRPQGKPFVRLAKPAPAAETLLTLAPLLRAAVILIGVSLLLIMLGQGVAELIERVRFLLMPRI